MYLHLSKGLKLNVEGHKAHDLVILLKYYYDNSDAAKQLFETAATLKDRTVIITLQELGNVCHTIETEVSISWEACKNNLRYLGESALFELQNAANVVKFFNVKVLGKDVLDYGRRLAIIESESSETLVSILEQLPGGKDGYKPSSWGEKQIDIYNNHPSDFVTHFIEQPHETGASGIFGLKSKHKYAYQKIPEIKEAYLQLYKMVEIQTKIGYSTRKYRFIRRDKGDVNLFKMFSEKWSNKEAFFIWLIYAARAIERIPGWKVTWNRKFTEWDDFAGKVINKMSAVNRNPKNVTFIQQELMKLF